MLSLYYKDRVNTEATSRLPASKSFRSKQGFNIFTLPRAKLSSHIYSRTTFYKLAFYTRKRIKKIASGQFVFGDKKRKRRCNIYWKKIGLTEEVYQNVSLSLRFYIPSAHLLHFFLELICILVRLKECLYQYLAKWKRAKTNKIRRLVVVMIISRIKTILLLWTHLPH